VQAGELALLRGVEQVDVGEAVERLDDGCELGGCVVAAASGVAAGGRAGR
jgi:hypothetical protein